MLSKFEMENLKSLIELAASGDAAAQYRLAAHYDRAGKADEARNWTEKAAAAGHPGALYTRATQLLSAKPEDMRVGEAVTMLSLAAEAGGAAACRQLAVLTALGLGVKRSWTDAVALVAKAARLGHPSRDARACSIIVDGRCKWSVERITIAASGCRRRLGCDVSCCRARRCL